MKCLLCKAAFPKSKGCSKECIAGDKFVEQLLKPDNNEKKQSTSDLVNAMKNSTMTQMKTKRK